jgi:hypothetical protein
MEEISSGDYGSKSRLDQSGVSATHKLIILPTVLHPDIWFTCFAEDSKREMCHVGLNAWVIEVAPDKSFNGEDAELN